MGYLVGDSVGLSTWGKCRRVMGQVYYDTDLGEYVSNQFPDIREDHNFVYVSSSLPRFKSAEGMGLIRGGFVSIPPGTGNMSFPRFEFFEPFGSPPEVRFFAAPLPPQHQDALLGKDVTVGGGTFAIDVTAFSTGQDEPASLNGPISAVEEMTAF